MVKSKQKARPKPKSKAYPYTPDPQNIRLHTEANNAMIDQSLDEVGGFRSIGVDGDGIVRVGNGVYERAKAKGLKLRPVVIQPDELLVAIRPDLKGEKAERAAFYDNRSAELSTWNFDLISKIADERPEAMNGIFDRKVLAEYALISKLAEGANGQSGVDAEPQTTKANELRKKWNVKIGDMFRLGDHRIICGDCTDKIVVKKVMGNEKADMVFTDPPYGVAIGEKNKFLNSFQKAGMNLENIAGDLMGKDELFDMLVRAFTLARETALSSCCAVYVTAPQGGELGMMMMMMMMMMSGLPVRHVLNWIKNCPTFSMGRLDYEYQHEPILYTWTKTHKHYGAGKFKSSVWFIDKPRSSKEHPTMKPIELYENGILNSSLLGQIIYEPFSGSGTSILACERLGRKCRAIEIEPGYVAVALQRWADATGKKPERVS